ncbi:MAG: electron transfer flavoprotein subunit alpha/FixB family protein [Acidobacteriaceae bacterium]|jgi:electron transfer flavoprotein alpha subunit
MSGVLVVVEHRNGALTRTSLEALAAGQTLAASLSMDCSAAVLGEGVAALAEELGGKQLAKVFAVEHPLLQQYTADGTTIALQQFLEKLAPAYVLFPHSYQVRDFAPALATRFGQVLISDVIGIHSDTNDGPTFVRQLFQGKLNADYRPAAAQVPCFVSIQAGAFRADALEPASALAPVESFSPSIEPGQIRTMPSAPFREAAHTVDLTSAPVIVSVGRGIREQENIPLVQALADALGAELAASRPICDAGWLPMERQVGSSGQTVSPKLYLAVGISGAIQHLVGMKGSKTVIAINKDENAPIFEVADYGVAADLFEIVPALTKAILASNC